MERKEVIGVMGMDFGKVQEVQERIERLRELNQYLEEAIEELTELLVLLVGMKKKVDRKIRDAEGGYINE